jgi:carboxypeptidase Q
VGTGATDNGVSCAIIIEAMRILKSLQLPLARTIRVALWAGEERGLRGSRAYVADFKRLNSEKHHLYFNLDGSGGRIRGLQVQGREEWLAIADRWLAPFKASGQAWISFPVRSGSDQLSFEEAGLRTMVFLTDPAFSARTYHSNMDLLDYVSPEDLKSSAAVVAAVLYQAAND